MAVKPTVFSTGPKDEVAVVDVYKETEATPLNKVVDAVKTSAADVLAAAGQTVTLSNLLEKGTEALTAGRFDKDTALRELNEATGGLLSTINNLKSMKTDLVEQMLKGVGFNDDVLGVAKGALGLPGGKDPAAAVLDKNPKLKFVYDSVTHARQTADLDTARGVADLLNSVAGNSELAKVLDMQSQFAVLGTIVNAASAYNIPDILDTVLTRLEDEEERTAFLLAQAQQFAQNSDIYGLTKVLAKAGPHQLLSRFPDIVTTILENYQNPQGVKKPTVTETTALLNLLNGINPHWFQYYRNGTWISNLETYQVISRAAKDTLLLSVVHRKALMFANRYPSVKFRPTVKKYYPLVAFTA